MAVLPAGQVLRRLCTRREEVGSVGPCLAGVLRHLLLAFLLPPTSPSALPPFLGSWCLTQTHTQWIYRHVYDEVKDALLCAMSGHRASGMVSWCAPLSSPPCHPPQGPLPESPALAPGIPQKGSRSLTQRGRPFSNVVERLTRRTANDILHPYPQSPLPFVHFFYALLFFLSFSVFMERVTD